MRKPNGMVLYEGPSMLDGQPIIAVVTGLSRRSENPKTGNMLQVYILRSDVDPLSACQDGSDCSICGDCPRRHYRGGDCYVRVEQGPGQVYRAYKRGAYPPIVWDLLRDRPIRIGTYGDPAALPPDIADLVCHLPGRWTAYTHAYWTCKRSHRWWCMASVDNLDDRAKAHKLGYRTFRVVDDYSEISDGEIICPADNKGITCEECGLCNGTKWADKSKVKDIVIRSHGIRSANNKRGQ